MVITDLVTFAQTIGLSAESPVLEEALTHSSYAAEHDCASNERLEFLGDAVLGLIVAEYVLATYPEFNEDRASVLRTRVVNEDALADCARAIALGGVVRVGRGEIKQHGYERASLLADAFEAVIAALYLDRGYEAARDFVLDALADTIAEAAAAGSTMDPKSQLVQWSLRSGHGNPIYTVVAHGVAPEVTFVADVVAGPVSGRGEARSKKKAELAAASAAWKEVNA